MKRGPEHPGKEKKLKQNFNKLAIIITRSWGPGLGPKKSADNKETQPEVENRERGGETTWARPGENREGGK